MQARIRDANSQLGGILIQARDALAGRQDVTPETLRDISQRLTELAPVLLQAVALRSTDIALDSGLQKYAQNLADLQSALEQVQFMLLARQTRLEASRCHLETVNLWATAFQQTR